MTIVQDTREKKPWSFEFFGVEQIRETVKTGDYTIVGYENQITVDRKQSIGELYQNLFKDYTRFKKEMERMECMESYVLCEFPYSDILNFPDGMPLVWCSKAKKKIPLKLHFGVEHIIKKIETITDRYGVEFIYCDNRREAELAAYNILKEFYEKTEACN